ncbi:7295_t:CDS:2 [Funneliformis geosporum]|uniref:19689_t:CDS:1 n=1 Tax=Funneliformis geosporum TaxID=1117311 RepID=A0A9W4SK89_9GLOM|nr:7295_t:CDS:2 [Funneliformis geosporum]CAI2172439.1 19689_t:CDS:2 [Funneliformis geosporum]
MSKTILSSIYRSLDLLHFSSKNLSLLYSSTKLSPKIPYFFISTQQYATKFTTYYKDDRFHKPYDNIGKGNPAIRPKQPLGPDGKDADIRYKEGKSQRYRINFEENYVNASKSLLEDFPQWLSGLRLQKYKNCFNGMKWQEIIHFDGEKLQKLGVNTIGARNKFLKTFEVVKKSLNVK